MALSLTPAHLAHAADRVRQQAQDAGLPLERFDFERAADGWLVFDRQQPTAKRVLTRGLTAARAAEIAYRLNHMDTES